MKTIQAFFAQFEALTADFPPNLDKLVPMHQHAWDAYQDSVQNQGIESYMAQFWLTCYRMISVEIGETEQVENEIRTLIDTHANQTTAVVSYLHDLADIYFELCNRDLNNDSLFQKNLDITEQYRDLIKTFPEMKSVTMEPSEAELLLEALLCQCIHNHKGEANPDTISAMAFHGQRLVAEDIYDEAQDYFAYAHSGACQLYGPDDSRTIFFQTHLGHCAYVLGNTDEALTHLEQAFRLGAQTDSGRAFVVNQLGRIYTDQDLVHRALRLYQDWCQDSPLSAARTMDEVMVHLRYAELLSHLGKNHYAIRIAESSSRRMDHLFGREDPDALYVRSVVADLYGAAGDHNRAIKKLTFICENAPDEYREMADYLHTWIKLGYEYVLNGDYSKGLEIIDEYGEIFAQHPSTSDADQLRVMNMKAIAYGFLEDQDSEFRIMQDIYTRSIHIHGENHYNTLLYENNLAVTCSDLAVNTQDPVKAAQWEQLARQYSWDVYKRSASTKGPTDLFTMLALSNKARLVERSGDLDNAQRMLQRVYDVHSAEDPDSPETLEAMYNLGRLYAEKSQFDQAVTRLSQCASKLTHLLGKGHPDTLRCLKELAYAGYSFAFTRTLNADSESERAEGTALYRDSLSHFLDYLDAMRHRATEAFYIESLENRANFFRDVNELLGEVLRWCENAAIMEIDFDAETIFEHMSMFKNISFDIMLQKKNHTSARKRSSLYQELLERISLGEENLLVELEALRREIWTDIKLHDYFHGANGPIIPQIQKDLGSAICLDVWEQSDAYHVFAIDKTSTRYQTLCNMEEIDEHMTQPLIARLKRIAESYECVYLCLHNKSMSYPIAALLSEALCIPVVCLNSITCLLNQTSPKHSNHILFAAPEDSTLCCEVQLIEQSYKQLSSERITFSLKDLQETTMSGILHISTHGIYEKHNSKTGIMDSYLYSEEGKIHANDLMAIHMNDVELVFLSACQSDIGKPFGAFGPYSVSRAFQIAGARYTISTLWNVPIVSAIAFADQFYALLNQGSDIVSAFHRAQSLVREYDASKIGLLMKRLAVIGTSKEILREIFTMTAGKEYPLQDQIHWAGYVLYQG